MFFLKSSGDIRKKRVIISVTNDLTTDQRVDRVANTLVGMGFDPLLVGRNLPQSLPLHPRSYRMKRMKLFFLKGPEFYAEYNIHLFFFLLFHKAELLVSNDLDSLPANFLASRIRRIPHIHDCHEYFRGVPELNGREKTIKAWKRIEDHIFPKLKSVYAVNNSVASIYEKEYGIPVKVIRNVPFRREKTSTNRKAEMGIPDKNRVILYQGAINIDRGLEEAILAMKFVKTPSTLVIIGIGDIFEKLKQFTIDNQLDGKVKFTGQIPLEQLFSYTQIADIGLSIEKDVSLNYHFCLPNKFLDYIQAEIPVLISPLPEMKAIVEKYDIGRIISGHEPEMLANDIDDLLNSPDDINKYRKNLKIAAGDLCWENEEKELIRIYKPYV
ncbi:MAG: glycosyltransferase family 4 protein [Bacteroidota bacterium]|nr:glycosyltransferase family 4 protein [Bacteroidota bacterium]